MEAIGAYVTALLTSAQTGLAIPIGAVGLFAGGATWALGNHERGKSLVIAALIGLAVMLLALTVVKTVGALPH
jgi:ABC-type Fe3+-siderophore transport system permease subunit